VIKLAPDSVSSRASSSRGGSDVARSVDIRQVGSKRRGPGDPLKTHVVFGLSRSGMTRSTFRTMNLNGDPTPPLRIMT
jgi:hypothetical protein